MKRVAECAVPAIAAAVFCAPIASADTGQGVDATTLWEMTDQGHEYVFREIVIAPGGSTGWHYHPGRVLATVEEGLLLHNRADCAVDGLYYTGQDIVETPGPDHAHIGRNIGLDPVVLRALYITPVDSPLAVDVPDPGCGFD